MHVESKMVIDRGEDELEIEIEGELVPAVAGRSTGSVESCFPSEGGYVEDITATLDGAEFELTEDEEERAKEILESVDVGNDCDFEDKNYD